MRRLLLATLLLVAALPGVASGHATMTSDSGRITWRSSDTGSASQMQVTVVAGNRVRIYDPGEDGGMAPANGCDPGAANAKGEIIEVTCPLSGITELFLDLAGGDDKAAVDVPLVVLVNARDGNDVVTTGGSDDTIFGGNGNDVLDPGAGADVVQGEAGDDELKVRDGVADQVSCAEGNDRAETDERDAVAADAGCETVNGGATLGGDPGPGPTPAPGPAGTPADATAPRVEIPGARAVRTRGGRFTLRVGVDEPSRLTITATVRIGRRSYRVRGVSAAVDAPGVRRVTVRLPARARSALRRSRRGSASLTVVARDAAGNAGRARVSLRLRA